MKRATLAIIAPPIAVWHYGSAERTAGPIAVFWLAGLMSIFYGLTGAALGELAVTRWILIGLGLVLWAIAAVWSWLVLEAVESDAHHDPDSPMDHTVEPRLNEPDPLKEVERGR